MRRWLLLLAVPLAACAPDAEQPPLRPVVYMRLCRLDDLAVGSAVRQGGGPIGRVIDIAGDTGRWIVAAELIAPRVPLRRTDTLEVRSTSLIGADVLEVIPGDTNAPRVVSGTWMAARARLATAAQRRALVRTLGALTGAATLTVHLPPGSFAADTICNAARTGAKVPLAPVAPHGAAIP